MLDLYYATEMPLTTDKPKLYRLLRVKGKDQLEAVDSVLEEFFDQSESGWVHCRCDAEIARAQEKSHKASASASKRWQSEGNANALRTALPTQCEGNAPNNQEPRTNSQEPKKTKGNGSAFAPPLWIPKDAWHGFEAMRTKIRKPMTDRAREMIITELEKLRERGEDPIAVLAQSERNCWQDVFPVKAKTGGAPDYSAVIANLKD